MRGEHRGDRGGIWRDDDVFIQSLLEPKARHAEGLVVVIAGRGLVRIGRLGDSPRQTQGLAVLDLTGHSGANGLGKTVPGKLRSSNLGITYSNIGPAPGDQAESACCANEVAAKLKPVTARRLAPCDGQIARQASFRSEKVVTRAVQSPLRYVEPDCEEMSFRPVQRPEVHGCGHGFGPAKQARIRFKSSAARDWLRADMSALMRGRVRN